MVASYILEMTKCRFLLGKTIDVLLYVDRLDAYRMDTLDEQVIRAITNSFGKDIWRRALVVLTHAQLSPPDGIDYNDFFRKRSEALLRYIRSGAGINKREYGVMHIFYFNFNGFIMLSGMPMHYYLQFALIYLEVLSVTLSLNIVMEMTFGS